MVKNYPKNVIRIRKGKPSVCQVYWIIVILNKKRAKSLKSVEKVGFFRTGKQRLFSMNYERLAFFLNKGIQIKTSILKYLYRHSKLYMIRGYKEYKN